MVSARARPFVLAWDARASSVGSASFAFCCSSCFPYYPVSPLIHPNALPVSFPVSFTLVFSVPISLLQSSRCSCRCCRLGAAAGPPQRAARAPAFASLSFSIHTALFHDYPRPLLHETHRHFRTLTTHDSAINQSIISAARASRARPGPSAPRSARRPGRPRTRSCRQPPKKEGVYIHMSAIHTQPINPRRQ